MAVAAYFLLAIASTVDKLLMTGRIPHPVVYAFFVSVLSIIALVLAPFGMQLLPLDGLLISLLSGLFLTGALLFFFTAVNDNDATRVVPFVGGIVPLFTVVLAYFFLGERFDTRHFLAFLILVVATVFISVDIDKRGRLKGMLAGSEINPSMAAKSEIRFPPGSRRTLPPARDAPAPASRWSPGA